jgi:hypothetical protein
LAKCRGERGVGSIDRMNGVAETSSTAPCVKGVKNQSFVSRMTQGRSLGISGQNNSEQLTD